MSDEDLKVELSGRSRERTTRTSAAQRQPEGQRKAECQSAWDDFRHSYKEQWTKLLGMDEIRAIKENEPLKAM
jgi:hypothetical protein